MAIRTALASVYLFLVIHEALYQYTRADIYMHTPRGSNNRLNGDKENRRNANRLFDSQNNGKGGYNVGEKEQKKGSQESDWFNMNYYMSGPGEGKTILPIEWTNQHGCGHEDLNCNIVIQFMCQPTSVEGRSAMRNGRETKEVSYRKKSTRNLRTSKNKEKQAKSQAKESRGLNEQWESYDMCARRERNKGLFTADQDLKNNDARSTRQNPNGNRHGYECPEERDYYPYWHPTPWKDIAVLADKEEDCSYYKNESFNTNAKGLCLEKYEREYNCRHFSEYNNETACKAEDGKWVNFHNYLEILHDITTEEECNKSDQTVWGIPYDYKEIAGFKCRCSVDPETWKKCLKKLPELDCTKAPTSRTNHLGNGENIVPMSYNWVLPHFPSGQDQRCVLRIRYNISTNDYDPRNTFASSNNNNDVIENDPDVEIGKGDTNKKVELQLAINTAQFGRTFQDRSHIFKIIPRKENFEEAVIHNLNVRGKRGNIVQVYPAVEYDFTHKNLEMKSSHYVHIQFTGSNNNPQNNDGEGRAKTDRSNLVAMESPDLSYPLKDTSGTLFDKATVIDAPNPKDLEKTKNGDDIAIAMATAGHFKRAQDVPSEFEVKDCNEQQAQQLDCYPPSYTGLLLKLEPGQYHYMCSRNNNFTNRNQKASITVAEG